MQATQLNYTRLICVLKPSATAQVLAGPSRTGGKGGWPDLLDGEADGRPAGSEEGGGHTNLTDAELEMREITTVITFNFLINTEVKMREIIIIIIFFMNNNNSTNTELGMRDWGGGASGARTAGVYGEGGWTPLTMI